MITPKGYIRIWDPQQKRLRFQHVIVWEQHHKKPLPKGMQIHHRDGDKTNNSISNLEAVKTLTHKRIHSGCVQRSDGTWFKPCGKCHEMKSETEYYKQGNWLMSECKTCHIIRAVQDKKKRKHGKTIND